MTRGNFDLHFTRLRVILAHSLGGLRHDELTALGKADRAVGERLPVLDRLLTTAFRAERPDLAPCAGQASGCPPRGSRW